MRERPMRIALLTHSVNARGGVVHVLELGRALHEAGHHVTIFAPALPGQQLFRSTPCDVRLVPVGPSRGLAQLVEQRVQAFVEALSHQRFDIWHAHDGIGGNALATLAERGHVGPWWMTVHHVDRFADAQVQAWQQRAMQSAPQLLCVSRLWQQRLRDEWSLDATQVDNGVDLQRFTPQPDHNDARLPALPGAPLILSVGGIEARKNTCRLFEAVVRLRERLPGAALVIAGGASLLDHQAERQALQAAMAAHPDVPVTLLGPVPDALMPALYRRASVLAMPSLMEGFGLAALEALACGTPAVVSRQPPFTEHFADGDVFWADPLDADSIAAALQHAAAAPRGVAAEVCRRFDWARSAERHAQIYRQPLHAPLAA
jgi:glycosyltransferase-like protein